jgi:hypothetical protein
MSPLETRSRLRTLATRPPSRLRRVVYLQRTGNGCWGTMEELWKAQRNLDLQLGSTLRLCVDPHAPPDQPRPLVQADQPQTTSAPRLGEIEALPVVGNGQFQAGSGASQGDVCLACTRMRGDVAQALLGDAVEAERNVLRNGTKVVGRERDLDAVLAADLGAMRS